MKPQRALLVIDVQNEYFTGKLPVTHPAESFEKILMVMDAAHTHGVPVIVIQHSSSQPDAKTFARGSDGWRLHDEVEKRHRDHLIEKTLPGSFTGTALEEVLKSIGADTIVICGYMTQMCCDTTSRQAFHLGLAVEFLSDATGTLDIANNAGKVSAEELHRAVLVTQAMRFARVIPSSEWMDEVARG